MVVSLPALALAALVSGDILAQGRGGGAPKPPASYPGTAVFRCNVGVACPTLDGFLGDGTNYPGSGIPESGLGAHLRTSNGELWLGFRNGSNITLDFRGQTGTLCGSNCRWDYVNDQVFTPDQDYYNIQSNVVDANGNETANGLLGILVLGSGRARFNTGIYEAANATGFVLNFNRSNPDSPSGDNGSQEVAVFRAEPCTWIFNGDGKQAFMKSGVRKSRVDEGLFDMPFEMTFTAPGCES